MRKYISLLILALALPGFAQNLNDAPAPKHEAVKFAALTTFFGGSAVFQSLAQHHGAQLCKIEALRQGIPWAANSSSSGFRPDNADRREAYITGGIYAGALVLELTGHRTAAERILMFGGAVNYGIAGATYWAGCN